MSNIVTDSVLFLSGSRKVLASMIEASGVEDNELAADYMLNEASDYEVISCLVNGELPEERFNEDAEMVAWEQYREFVNENFDELSANIDHSALEEISENLGPISLLGLSSQPSILEFQIHDGRYAELTEGEKLDKFKKAVWDTPKKYWGDKKNRDRVKKAVVDTPKKYWGDKYKKYKAKKLQADVDKMGKTSRRGQGSGGLEKVDAKKDADLLKKKGLRTSRSGQGSGGGKPTRWQKIKGATAAALRDTGRAIKKGAEKAGAAIKKGAKATADVAKKAGKGYVGALKGEKGRGAQAAAITGTAAAGAAAAYGAYKAYKARKKAKLAAKEKAAKQKAAAAKA